MFGVLLVLLGIGALCVMFFNAAAYTVPVFAALWAGFGALHLGAGPVGAFAIGCFAGGVVFGLARAALAFTRSNIIRLVVVACFVLPAAAVGYCCGVQLSALTPLSEIWQQLCGIIAALAVGAAAFVRLVTPLPPSHRPLPAAQTGARN